MDNDTERLLRQTADKALEYLRTLPDRHVGAREDARMIATRIGGPLPEASEGPAAVLDRLVREVDPGIVASAGPRYFGFVIGGTLPAALAADWMTAAWDQNAAVHALSPAGAAAEQVCGEWMLDLLGLPPGWSTGLPTGAGLGNAIGIASARHALLDKLGWDVEQRGLFGAPEIEVITGEETHATVLTALQYLGLGRERVTKIPTDENGAMKATEMAEAVSAAADKPVVLIAQAGNVNTGAFDPLPAIVDAATSHPNAWVHVDGAFGLWASASPRLAHLTAGVDGVDSASTDAHKWLNVGYDCGFVGVRDSAAHRASMGVFASYLMPSADNREGWEYVLDSSRRARGFALYATLRSLGRQGVRELIERCCDLAVQLADRLRDQEGVEVLNDVVLNQVLVRFGDDDAHTRATIERVQAEGVAWMGGTVWKGNAAMRVSVSNWSTTAEDIDKTADSILRAHRS